MSTITVSPKYQIVIPKEVREQLRIKSGQKMSVVVTKGIMHVIPTKSLKELEGYLKGMDTSNVRDEEDRL